MKRAHTVVLVVMGALGACHFDDSFQIDLSVDPHRPDTEYLEACTERSEAGCAYYQRCDPYSFEWSWPDMATCVERSAMACQLNAADPDTGYDEAYIRDCKIPPGFLCESDPGYQEAVDAFLEQCPTPGGDRDDGQLCLRDNACRSGYCDRSQETEPGCGVCGTPPCDICSETERCTVYIGTDGTVSAVTCDPVAEDGAACQGDQDCASYRCEEGVCTPRSGEGDPCDAFNDCLVDDAFGYCNPETGLCAPVELVGLGERCDGWSEGTICGGGRSCLGGFCRDPAADGTPCDPAQGVACRSPATCLDGFCRFRRAIIDCSE